MEFTESERINQVHVDGLVVLKIAQHCTNALPNLVTGSLLGLDSAGVLEASNCFPFASNDEGEDMSDTIEGETYQLEMLRAMDKVNADHNCIGWYRSSLMGSFQDLRLIQDQYAYQKDLSPNSVVLIFDPVRTTNGSLTLKAYRLTKEFMETFTASTLANLTQAQLSSMESSEVFDELPLKITNSSLAQTFLYDLKSEGEYTYDSERLALTKDSVLESHLEILMEGLDDYTEELRSLHNYNRNFAKQKQLQQTWIQKRKDENASRKESGLDILPETDASLNIFKPLAQPSRLESLLIANQIEQFSDHVQKHATESMHKLNLTREFQ
jgi:translation initiation factor 3 subunit H